MSLQNGKLQRAKDRVETGEWMVSVGGGVELTEAVGASLLDGLTFPEAGEELTR